MCDKSWLYSIFQEYYDSTSNSVMKEKKIRHSVASLPFWNRMGFLFQVAKASNIQGKSTENLCDIYELLDYHIGLNEMTNRTTSVPTCIFSDVGSTTIHKCTKNNCYVGKITSYIPDVSDKNIPWRK